MIGASTASDSLYLFEHGRGLLREKAAIVGRQADGGVARVDLAAERGDVVVVVAGDGGKGVAGGHAFVDVVANGFAQAVVVVAAVVDGQQIAVLGVEEEEQAVEEDEGGLADILQFCAAFVGEGADEGGIDFIEDDAGKIVCDLFFVAAAFGDGVFKEAGLGAMLGAEGGSTKEEAEGAQSDGSRRRHGERFPGRLRSSRWRGGGRGGRRDARRGRW